MVAYFSFKIEDRRHSSPFLKVKFCKQLFPKFELTPELLEAVVDYKDAYLMKEVIGKFYDEKYFVRNFGCGKLCTRGKICVSE